MTFLAQFTYTTWPRVCVIIFLNRYFCTIATQIRNAKHMSNNKHLNVFVPHSKIVNLRRHRRTDSLWLCWTRTTVHINIVLVRTSLVSAARVQTIFCRGFLILG